MELTPALSFNHPHDPMPSLFYSDLTNVNPTADTCYIYMTYIMEKEQTKEAL